MFIDSMCSDLTQENGSKVSKLDQLIDFFTSPDLEDKVDEKMKLSAKNDTLKNVHQSTDLEEI